MNKFRLLRADEIDVRVGSVMNGAATLLLYKDARCDMNILDETIGVMNWKREHTRDNRNCIVSIWDPEKDMWISKEDTGTESNTEKEKGLASDSFKRACVNFGIGRELYTAPRIRIQCETKPKQNGYGYELANRWEFYGAYVSHIAYDDNGNISQLEIVKDDRVIYEKESKLRDMDNQITKEEAKTVRDYIKKLGLDEKEICQKMGVASLEAMSNEQCGKCKRKLMATEKKQKGEK